MIRELKENSTHSQIHERTQSCPPSMNSVWNITFVRPLIEMQTFIQFNLQAAYSFLLI